MAPGRIGLIWSRADLQEIRLPPFKGGSFKFGNVTGAALPNLPGPLRSSSQVHQQRPPRSTACSRSPRRSAIAKVHSVVLMELVGRLTAASIRFTVNSEQAPFAARSAATFPAPAAEGSRTHATNRPTSTGRTQPGNQTDD